MAQPAVRGDDDRAMRGVYARVILCHAAVIALLWWFGRTFSA
jgi:hypothetical protein